MVIQQPTCHPSRSLVFCLPFSSSSLAPPLLTSLSRAKSVHPPAASTPSPLPPTPRGEICMPCVLCVPVVLFPLSYRELSGSLHDAVRSF
jgi:hypothetical protein